MQPSRLDGSLSLSVMTELPCSAYQITVYHELRRFAVLPYWYHCRQKFEVCCDFHLHEYHDQFNESRAVHSQRIARKHTNRENTSPQTATETCLQASTVVSLALENLSNVCVHVDSFREDFRNIETFQSLDFNISAKASVQDDPCHRNCPNKIIKSEMTDRIP